MILSAEDAETSESVGLVALRMVTLTRVYCLRLHDQIGRAPQRSLTVEHLSIFRVVPKAMSEAGRGVLNSIST